MRLWKNILQTLFGQKLPVPTAWQRDDTLIKQLFDAGHYDRLTDIARAILHASPDVPEIESPSGETVETITVMLAASSASTAVGHVMELLYEIHTTSSEQFARYTGRLESAVAAILPASQTFETLVDLFAKCDSRSPLRAFLLTLLQEMALHRMPCDANPILLDFIHHTSISQYPLAGLPLRLLPIEQHIQITAESACRFVNVRTSSIYDDNKTQPMSKADTGTIQLPNMHLITTEHDAEALRAAVSRWDQYDDCQIIALDSPIAPEEVTPVFVGSIGTESLAGDTPALYRSSAGEVFYRLFNAAAFGGPYDYWQGGWGRLYAWQSLAALSGIRFNHNYDEIADVAEDCTWFMPYTDWFVYIAWDLAILALRPDHRTMALLAATATD